MNEGNKKRLPYLKESIFTSVLVGIFVFAFIEFQSGLKIDMNSPLMGEPAPEIEYETPEGKPAAISKQKGTTVLLNFWATWCAPCMEEMPSLVALENHYAKKGLLLLAFNIEDAVGNDVEGKVAGNKMPRNVIYKFSKSWLRMYDVKNIPLSILIDKKGVVRRVWAGPRDWMRIENLKEFEEILDD